MVDPQPYDLVRLSPSSADRAGTTPETVLIVADIVEERPGTYVLWHLDTHPDHQDWAAAVTIADIAAITRITARGDASTWTPSP